MQQYCNNCSAPITAGMTACARCGAPVAIGSGGYDPTVRAGQPPGTGYGSQPYGPPPIDPYGAPPPQPGYGAPPPPPGFGAPPGAGYGAPPGVGYGAPQQPFMAPPPKKSKTWLYVLIGILVVVLLACGGIAFALNRAGNAIVNAVNTVGATVTIPVSERHISNVHIGVGDREGNISQEQTTFTQEDFIVIDFTVTTDESGAQVLLKLYSGSTFVDQIAPITLDTGTHDYFFGFRITGADDYTAQLIYNGTDEQNVNFTVT